ncbi:hypothetical protein HDV05_007461 [Chytridiales sp. JEL 0842]|nr:hypothetical protein HDV05_007461 [Chytridiales sp. JEL 0842]
MVDHLYKTCVSRGLFPPQHSNTDMPTESGSYGVVALRVNLVSKGMMPVKSLDSEPSTTSLKDNSSSKSSAAILHATPLLRTALSLISSDSTSLQLQPNSNLKTPTNIQILESLLQLPKARKLQGVAVLRDEGAIVVWGSFEGLVESMERWEGEVIKVVYAWNPMSPMSPFPTSDASSERLLLDKDESDAGKKGASKTPKRRPYIFIWPLISTLAIFVTIIFFGFGVSQLVKESLLDGNWMRMLLLLLLPLQILFTQFVPQAALSCILQIIGPIKQLKSNSVFYSGAPPTLPPPHLPQPQLPHITIQMPVYTESLRTVILPTLRSLQRAIATYESQGGTASIFINEDGMQVLPPPLAAERKRVYEEEGVGWIARPPHKKLGFERRGRFKKASNMNFCMGVSRDLEDLLDRDPEVEYDAALRTVLGEWEEKLGKGLKVLAGGDVLVGDLILLVDCDTRVPASCLMDAALEFLESGDLGILQHSSSPMLVTTNYFERGIAFFTEIVYTSIRYCTASGETAPFVGHNAFLRWSALKEVGFKDKEDKLLGDVVKYWSESHVSEDFDMSLRLQMEGYIVRYASYYTPSTATATSEEDPATDFQEGVSLSVYDEVTRWQKYAYGVSELVFQPLWRWPTRGPLTPLFRKFLGCNMSLHSKLNIIGYIGSYYAIGSAWILTILNYLLVGFWDDELDRYYLPSFDVLFTTLLVFTVLSNIAFAVFRYRLQTIPSLPWALWENIRWIPFFAVFFSGLSFHVSVALVAHLVGYNMQWGSTAKELEDSNFFKEVPKVVKGYKIMYVVFILLVVFMGILGAGTVFGETWQSLKTDSPGATTSHTPSSIIASITKKPYQTKPKQAMILANSKSPFAWNGMVEPGKEWLFPPDDWLEPLPQGFGYGCFVNAQLPLGTNLIPNETATLDPKRLDCPDGFFCPPTGTSKPHPCRFLSICPRGSIVERHYGLLVIAFTIDLLLFLLITGLRMWESHKAGMSALAALPGAGFVMRKMRGRKARRSKGKGAKGLKDGGEVAGEKGLGKNGLAGALEGEDDTAMDLVGYRSDGNEGEGAGVNLCRGVSAVSQAISDMAEVPSEDEEEDEVQKVLQSGGGLTVATTEAMRWSVATVNEGSPMSQTNLLNVKRTMPFYNTPEEERAAHRDIMHLTGRQSEDVEAEHSLLSVRDDRSRAWSSIQVDDVQNSMYEDNHDMFSLVSQSTPLVEAFQKGTGNLRMNLKFDGLKCQVGNKTILEGVSGEFKPGRMTAILGPSGAGKTTFINVLMGKIRRSGGEITINGAPEELHSFKKIIGYVPQDDIMLRELTVREVIRYSARIRLPRSWSRKEVDDHVDTILKALNLEHVAHSRIGDEHNRGISGGQRKRVNIGMELAAAPLAVFLDEPTSGLDSTSALKVIKILRAISRVGLTIVSVIHQPRVEIFSQFDDVLILVPGGRTAYFGPVKQAKSYFESLGFVFKPSLNPADVIMDIVSGRGKKAGGNKVKTSVEDLVKAWETSSKAQAKPPKPEAEKDSAEDLAAIQATKKSTMELQVMRKLAQGRGASFLSQLWHSHNRSVVQQMRLSSALALEIFVGTFAGFIMGFAGNADEMYHGIIIKPFHPLSMSPNEWFLGLYGTLIGVAIAASGGPAGCKIFGEEREIYWREAASGHNKLAYFMGKNIASIYRLALGACHFTAIFFFLSKPPFSIAWQYTLHFLNFFCTYGLSIIISMVVRRDNASLISVIFGMFVALFNGYSPKLKDVNAAGYGFILNLGANRWAAEAQSIPLKTA